MTIKNLYAKKYMYALIAYSKRIDFRDGYGIFSAPCDGVEEAKFRVYSPDGEHVRTYEFDTFSATMDSKNQSSDEIDMLNNIITIIDSISGSYAMQAINCLKEIDEIRGCMCEYEINVDNYSSRDFEKVHSDFVNDWAECTSTGTDETGRYMETWETHSGEIYKIINNDYYPLSDDIPGQLQMLFDMPSGYRKISETVKNLTQFKKCIQPGMILHVLNHCRPECVGTLKKVTFKNTVDIRTAEINPENGGISGKEIYLDFGKSSTWTFENGIYTKYDDFGKIVMQFEIVEESRKEESEPMKGECTMMKPKKKVSIKAVKNRKSHDNGLFTVPNGRENDLKPVTIEKLQHDDGRIDTIATTQNGDSVCIMTAQTIDISGGIDIPETTAQAVENHVGTTAATEAETAEIKRFCNGTTYSANGLKFDCTGTKPGFIRIMIDGENKPRIMSAFIKNDCEYITYQHKTVTAFDIYADDTPTDGTGSPTESPEQSAPETIPPQEEAPSETPTEPETGKAEETEEKAELIELPETKSVKIFWNGIKVNGSKTLTTKCHYYYGNDDKHITIYARDYTKLPRDLFTVINNSDSMTDYFEQDHAVITAEHPLYKYFEYALDKQTEHDIKTYSKTGTGREFENMPNPGQPTAADLSAVAKYNADRAAAAKAKAEEKERAEQEEHDRQMSTLCQFSDDIVRITCRKYPIRDGAPTVRIEWSEHPAFSDGFRMSITAAQILFSIFDEKQATDRQKENHSGAWYYKTKFVIEFTDPETGEQSTYTGRQDFGDGEGGILEHMLNHAEWERTHYHDGLHRYGAPVENPPDKLDFIKWLSGFLESSPETETERPEITMQTNTDSTADTATTPTAGARAQKQDITVTFAPELKQAAEKHSENYAECEQIMNDIDTAVPTLPPEDIAHILDTLPRDTLGALMARRICQQYAKTDPETAAMLLGAWILDFTNDNGAAQ